MKKIFSILFLVISVFMFVSCKEKEDEPKIKLPSIELSLDKDTINVGETATLSVVVNDIGEYDPTYGIKTEDHNVRINGNKIYGMSKGKVTLVVYLENVNDISSSIILNVIGEDMEKPEFIYEGEKDFKLHLNESFNPLKGIKVVDNIDGDITGSMMVENNVDTTNYGNYTVKYKVTDFNGNVSELERNVEVNWGYRTKFIGHAGSYYGVMNTEEAFAYAVKELKYQALECDLKVTKDGVYVTCHDDDFGGKNIASTNYADLKDVEVTKSRKSGYPKEYGELKTSGEYTSTICTLEKYLEICKDFNATAVIELKGCKGISNSDQSGMQKLMDFIESKDMLNNVIFLGSAYNCLIWVKQHGYEYIHCQYLVDGCCKQEYLDRCTKYGLDLSVNVTYSTVDKDKTFKEITEWMDKYKAAGCEISTWTFTQYVDYSDVQKWLDYGVDYVTCDWHTLSKLKHYEVEE